MVTRLARLVLAAAVSLTALPALADFVCDAAVNRTSVPRGGEVVLTVSARGDVGWSPEFRLPNLPDVRVYAGSTNQSMSMVNGATETSVSRTFYLKVDTAGDFTIGPITIASDQGECATEPVRITVTAAADNTKRVNPSVTGNRIPPKGGATGSVAENSTAGKPGDDVFVTLEADHTEAWVGQQIVLTFRYLWRVQPWNKPSYTPPRTEGFWREDLGSERNYREVILGRAYTVTEIRYAVFPTRIGELVVEPAELSFPAGVFNRFFQTRRTRRGPSVLRTDPVTIQVRELPQPQPAGYSGIVASRLKLISQVDRDTVPRGEAIGLKVMLNADGFMKGFHDLVIPAPAEARLHDAGESFRTGVEDDRLTGKMSVEKVIVPGREGDLLIPPVELVWFDTTAGRFRTARTAAWNVAVTPSDRPLAENDESGFLRSEIARLGEDLAFIHRVPQSLSLRPGPFTGGALWWILLLLPVLLLAAYRLFLDKIAAEGRDPAGRRRRGALAAARSCLTADGGDRMSAVTRAVCGYVADCQDRPLASVGPVEVRHHCETVGLLDVGRQLSEILATCDAARYGQSDPDSARHLAAEAADLLVELDVRRRATARLAIPSERLSLLLVVLGTSLLLAVVPAAAGDVAENRPGTDPVRLVAEGNQAYTEGRLEDAAVKYLQARELGVNDPVLHFNLGNTYARSGHLGEAVVNYLRAQRLDPGNRDVRANLAWVRRHIRDLELSRETLPLFIAQLVGVVRALTLDQWGILSLVMVWGVGVLVAWGWYRQEVTTSLRRVLLGATAILVIVACITGGRWYVEQIRESAVVVLPEVVVRSGPAENFSPLFEVHDGLTLSIVGRREGWVRVGLGGDWEGWVPAASVMAVRLRGS